MVEDAWNRDVGFTYKPYKSTVAPIVRGRDDGRSAHLRNQFIDRVNDHRFWNNADAILSQGPGFFQNRENLSRSKPILTQLKGNQDFWTTDQDEKRNMYQMVMNNMRDGKGAQMLDLRGLPAIIQANPNKYRYGSRLFKDPAKRQGFFGDFGSLFSGKNKAAVRASTWNPLHTSGYGKDFYAQEFPLTNTIENILETGGIYGLLAGNLLGKRKRKVLPSDRSWIGDSWFSDPLNVIPNTPFMGEYEDEAKQDESEVSDVDLLAPYVENSKIPPQFNVEKLRREGRSGLFDLEDNIPTEVDEVINKDIIDTFDPELDGDALVEELFNNKYSFVNENPDLTPYEWIMKMVDHTGSTMDEIIQNGIFDGVLIEN
jgi:hypothetical protein